MFNNYYFIFGAIIIAAGFQGFLKGSKASLGGLVIAGTILGGTIGSILALVGSLGIAGKFLPAFLKAKDKGAALWPAGVLGIMAVVALVMIIRGLTGI
jgi:hypothetical protein